MADNTFLAPLSPIQRSTPSDRLVLFQRNESSIYNKFTQYYQAGGGIGPDQPFIYTKLTDSNFQKNLTKYDSQAVPLGSTTRDVIRMGKFMVSGTGLLFASKQLTLQNANPFNETRIYNPLSVVGAAAKTGTFGLTDRPKRYIETSGGLLNFFVDALLSSVGMQSRRIANQNNNPIEGTALGQLSNRVLSSGGGRAGLMRLNTAESGNANLVRIWGESSPQPRGFSFRSLIRSLVRFIPSTNPLGAFGGRPGIQWQYRIEYPSNSDGNGIYHIMKADNKNYLDFQVGSKTYVVGDINPYSAGKIPQNPARSFGTDDQEQWYASPKLPTDELYYRSNIGRLYERMVLFTDTYNKDVRDYVTREYTDRGLPRDLRNQSQETKKVNGVSAIRNALELINTEPKKYENIFYGATQFSDEIKVTIDARGFSKGSPIKPSGPAARADIYNKLSIIGGDRERGGSSSVPSDIASPDGQSVDVIFLYFFDLVNEKYIPFRAVELSSLADSNTAEWDPISYLGRADKLFIYKGFSRDVNFNFKVYANSIEELIPMWERINYLTGLVRPSKYTDPSTITNQNTISANATTDLESLALGVSEEDSPVISNTGKESRFIYPPMITFRVGDLFIDQPAVLNNVNVSIPQDTNWESIRKDSYEYLYSISKDPIKKDAKSRQLPLAADISVSLKLMEKEQAITNGAHYGYVTGNQWPI